MKPLNLEETRLKEERNKYKDHEDAQLVSEYNQIVEEIYAAIAKIRTDNEKSMVLSRKNRR